MFFHNILMMAHYKSWDEFCDYHPMVTWKNQGKTERSEKSKVEKRKDKNILSCAEKIASKGFKQHQTMNKGLIKRNDRSF